ncbi:unnamed protein product, partial [Amoebophrya sp. A25]
RRTLTNEAPSVVTEATKSFLKQHVTTTGAGKNIKEKDNKPEELQLQEVGEDPEDHQSMGDDVDSKPDEEMQIDQSQQQQPMIDEQWWLGGWNQYGGMMPPKPMMPYLDENTNMWMMSPYQGEQGGFFNQAAEGRGTMVTTSSWTRHLQQAAEGGEGAKESALPVPGEDISSTKMRVDAPEFIPTGSTTEALFLPQTSVEQGAAPGRGASADVVDEGIKMSKMNADATPFDIGEHQGTVDAVGPTGATPKALTMKDQVQDSCKRLPHLRKSSK